MLHEQPRDGSLARDRTAFASPAMIFRSVVLPEPEGPTRAVTSPGASAKAMSARMSLRSPAALRTAFFRMETSTFPASPTRCMSFKGLH